MTTLGSYEHLRPQFEGGCAPAISCASLAARGRVDLNAPSTRTTTTERSVRGGRANGR
jgi:hypothetical protein